MGPTLFITHRRMASAGTHQHVGWVKLLDGRILSRDEVFAYMHAGMLFRTQAPNGSTATVIRVHCRLGGHDYLRTDRDATKTDNLDELPLF